MVVVQMQWWQWYSCSGKGDGSGMGDGLCDGQDDGSFKESKGVGCSGLGLGLVKW